MKIIQQVKAGATLAPALLIFIYFLFVGLDLYTTYLASPDLKYEGNWLVRNLYLNWNQIIMVGILHAILTCVLFFLAVNYSHKKISESINTPRIGLLNMLSKDKKLLVSLFMVGYFYNHFLYSFFITINNYLSHLYINKIENVFSNISGFYINFEIMCGKSFFPVTNILTITAASIFTICLANRIKNRYMQLSGEIESRQKQFIKPGSQSGVHEIK
jgi:hypothetical protein